MSAKSMGSEVDGLFWPGFVDAISCLVLNLLFLTMVLTIAVFVLGQAQSVTVKELVEYKAVNKAEHEQEMIEQLRHTSAPNPPPALLVPAPAPAPVRAQAYPPAAASAPRAPGSPPFVLKPEPNPAVTGDVRIGGDARSNALIDIVFSSQIVIVPQERRAELVARMREIEATHPGRDYEVRIATDTTLSDARRNAYFRAVSVRDLMLAAGIRPLSISLRMESNGPAGGEGVVRIYPVKD